MVWDKEQEEENEEDDIDAQIRELEKPSEMSRRPSERPLEVGVADSNAQISDTGLSNAKKKG